MKKVILIMLTCVMAVLFITGCEFGKISITEPTDKSSVMESSTEESGTTVSKKEEKQSVLKEYLYNTIIPQYGLAKVGTINKTCKIEHYSFPLDWYQDTGVVSAYFIDDTKMIVTYLDYDSSFPNGDSGKTSSGLKIDLYINNNGLVKKKTLSNWSYIISTTAGKVNVFYLQNNNKQYLCIEGNTTGLIASGLSKKVIIFEITDVGLESVEKISCTGSSEFYVYNNEKAIGVLTDSGIQPKINKILSKYGLSANFDTKNSYRVPDIIIDKENCTLITGINVPFDETTPKPEKGSLDVSFEINDYTKIDRSKEIMEDKENSSQSSSESSGVSQSSASSSYSYEDNTSSPYNSSSDIIGTWGREPGDPDYGHFELRFYSDGTCSVKSEDARDEKARTYTFVNDVLTIYDGEGNIIIHGEFPIDGDTVTVEANRKITYVRINHLY